MNTFRKSVPVFLVFFVMGIADAMGPLADAVQKSYRVSALMATLLTSFVFIAFALFSVPGGLLAARLGKRRLLLLALGINAAGILVPSLVAPGFALLLGCIFVLGVGTTFLQVAGNPLMRDVSPVGRFARNLSFAQFVKGLGSSSSSYLVGLAALLPLLGGLGWRGAFPIFLFFTLLAAAGIGLLRLDETRADVPPGAKDSLALLRQPVFARAVLGIFLYVGAEVCLGRFLKPTLEGLGLAPERAALWGPSLFFAMLTLGRLGGGAVLNVLRPRLFFRISAALGLAGILVVALAGGRLAVAGVLLSGLGFANIWPLLFSITVEEKPERSAELSGLMCMAISGGAVFPLLMGWLADLDWGRAAYGVPLAGFLYLLLAALPARPERAEAGR